LVSAILDDSIEREVDKVTIELHSNIGEVKTYDFRNVKDAIDFLNREEFKEVFITTDSDTLYDPPPSFGDDEDDNNVELFEDE